MIKQYLYSIKFLGEIFTKIFLFSFYQVKLKLICQKKVIEP